MAEQCSADQARAAAQAAHLRREAPRTPDGSNLLAGDDEQRYREELMDHTFRKIRVLAEEGEIKTTIAIDTDADADEAKWPTWAEERLQALVKRLQSLHYTVSFRHEPRHPYGSFERYHRCVIYIMW